MLYKTGLSDLPHQILINLRYYTALIWQKEASDKSDISRKRAKCVCHLHWRQWNIRMSYLTYLLVGWVFLHEIWRRRRAHYVNYENINNSNLDGMSLASFCQSRAVYVRQWGIQAPSYRHIELFYEVLKPSSILKFIYGFGPVIWNMFIQPSNIINKLMSLTSRSELIYKHAVA